MSDMYKKIIKTTIFVITFVIAYVSLLWYVSKYQVKVDLIKKENVTSTLSTPKLIVCVDNNGVVFFKENPIVYSFDDNIYGIQIPNINLSESGVHYTVFNKKDCVVK